MGQRYEIKDRTDCAASIACKSGFSIDTLWLSDENRAIRETRPDKHTLAVGDVLVIPDKRSRKESAQTEQRHVFRRKGVSVELRLQLLEQDVPLKNLSYRLVLDDGKELCGTLDADGELVERISPLAASAVLAVGDGDDDRVYELELGGLDPHDTISGVQARLQNLGYDPGPVDNVMGPLTSAALNAFQEDEEDLEVTGKPDADTMKRLDEISSMAS